MRNLITYLIIVLSFILSLKAKSDNTYENLINKSEKNKDEKPFLRAMELVTKEKDLDKKYQAYQKLLKYSYYCRNKIVPSEMSVSPLGPQGSGFMPKEIEDDMNSIVIRAFKSGDSLHGGIDPNSIKDDKIRELLIEKIRVNDERRKISNYYIRIGSRKVSVLIYLERLILKHFTGKKREEELEKLKKYKKDFKMELPLDEIRKIYMDYAIYLEVESRRRIAERKKKENKKPKHPKKPNKDNNKENKGKKKGD